MSISASKLAARARDVSIHDEELIVRLVDGRRVAVPLEWFPRLLKATEEERSKFELLGDGEGIHWPDIDEDLSVEGLLRGTRPPS
jgi:hypothetical protein